jgi:hypothetical protein
MLISKRSRRKSDVFASRFRDGRGGDFPLRQYLRCREDLTSGIVHAFLLLAFAVTLVGFGRTVAHLFDSHGADLNPWLKRGALVLVAIFVLSVLRRLYYKVVELREIRRDMARLKSVFRDADPESDEV